MFLAVLRVLLIFLLSFESNRKIDMNLRCLLGLIFGASFNSIAIVKIQRGDKQALPTKLI
jgi:hypothetical protein